MLIMIREKTIIGLIMKTEMAELIERANQMIARLSKEAMNKDNLIEKVSSVDYIISVVSCS